MPREFPCFERLPQSNKYSILSRPSMTVLNSRKCIIHPIKITHRPECCIICLIYINRLIAFTEIPLQPTNWRPLTLCALLVAQKVWDDRYLSNADFAFIYPFFVTSEINKLEKKFLELIQYNVTVKSNLYAKYYFELRALFKGIEKEFPLVPLDKRQCENLEINSKMFGEMRDKDIIDNRLNSSFGGTSSKPMFDWEINWW